VADEKSMEERTETASAFRREEFRKQGTVALSREVVSVAILVAVGAVFYATGATLQHEFSLLAQKFFGFSPVTEMGKMEFLDLRFYLLRHFSWMVAPVFAVVIVVGTLACLAQVGFYVTWEPVQPNWERINPIAGFGRLFSTKGLVEALKAFIKLGIVITVVYYFFKARATGASNFFSLSPAEILPVTLGAVGKLFFSILGSIAGLSLLDYGYQRYQIEKQMRMTKREAKEEFKLREGDPLIKSRIRSIQRRMASRRMMENVPKADVVITNPTHLAIALKYDPETMAAPKVIAKGAGAIAQKIREMARFHRIPCVENKPLARTLFKQLDINEYIPRELYKAVAEVLAYVYRLKGRVKNG